MHCCSHCSAHIHLMSCSRHTQADTSFVSSSTSAASRSFSAARRKTSAFSSVRSSAEVLVPSGSASVTSTHGRGCFFLRQHHNLSRAG